MYVYRWNDLRNKRQSSSSNPILHLRRTDKSPPISSTSALSQHRHNQPACSSPILKQQSAYHSPIWRTAQALALQHDYAIAEELGIAVANASNESKYWQFIGDVIMQGPYSHRPTSIQWAQQCYQKAQQLSQK